MSTEKGKESTSLIKIGFIARADNSGLGNLSWEFYRHMKPHKTLVVQPNSFQIFKERYPERTRFCSKGVMEEKFMRWLLEDIDVLVTVETPYQWAIYKMAKRAKVKTVLIPMYECMPQYVPYEPDFYICPSEIDYDFLKDRTNKVTLPFPINTDVLPYKQREKAHTFVFHNGHGGGKGRNGVKELFDAIPLVKSDVKFLIYSQISVPPIDDNRVEVKVGNYKHYWDIWQEGDVYLHPHHFDGLSLPIQEALGSGMPVLSTKFYPFTEWLPEEWFFDVKKTIQAKIFQVSVDIHTPDAEDMARLIDEWANKDIRKESDKAREIAESRSWKVLTSKYNNLLTSLV